MPNIIGYSERGLVNALFESIVASKEPVRTMMALLETATLVENKYSVRKFSVDESLIDFDVYVEPSLSGFGDPDVLLFLEFKNSKPEVVFIEAKIEEFFSSSRKVKDLSEEKKSQYLSNRSTILHELFLKARFMDALQRTSISRLQDGIRVYRRSEKLHKIGNKPLVRSLAHRIKDCHPWFFALTTDRGHEAKQEEWAWQLGREIYEHILYIDDENSKADRSFQPRDGRAYWGEMTYLWSWQEIYEKALSEPALERLISTMKMNIPNFKFPNLDHENMPDEFKTFFEKLGLKLRQMRTNPNDWQTYYARKAVLTCRLIDCFGCPALEVRLVKKSHKGKLLVFKNDAVEFCQGRTNSIAKRILEHKERS